jgi:hypothetical protein
VFTSQVALLAVLARIGNLRIPFLLMQSGPTAWSTRPPPPAGPSKLPPELVSFYSWPGLYHEMWNEPERHQVFELMEKQAAKLARRTSAAVAPDLSPWRRHCLEKLILASPFLADRLVSRLLAGCLPEHLRSIESGNDQTRRGPEAARSHPQSGLAFESHQTI